MRVITAEEVKALHTKVNQAIKERIESQNVLHYQWDAVVSGVMAEWAPGWDYITTTAWGDSVPRVTLTQYTGE